MSDENKSGKSVVNQGQMVMKFPMLGQKLKGFVIAPYSGIFGEMEVEMTPDEIKKILGYSFSFTRRYLGFFQIMILYADEIPTDSMVTVQGKLPEDKIKGNIIIFANDNKTPTSLDDFMINTIRSNLELYKTEDDVMYVMFKNVTLKKEAEEYLDIF